MSHICADGRPVADAINEAIRISIAEDRRVRVSAASTKPLILALLAECVDDFDTGCGGWCFWGYHLDGNIWSILVAPNADGDA